MSLTDKEFMRYNRHLMLAQVGEKGQLQFKNARVLIVGMGGLGCPASQYLAASGIGELTLVDHDVIESSNLQRQILFTSNDIGQSKANIAKSRLTSINPFCHITALHSSIFDIDLANMLKSIDVVLDCTDNLNTRNYINKHCVKAKVKLVSASAIQGTGQLVSFDFAQPTSPCYQCIFSVIEQPKLNCSTAGVFSPLLGVMGSMQAAQCLKLLLTDEIGSDINNRLFLYDGWGNQLNQFKVTKDPSCTCCNED